MRIPELYRFDDGTESWTWTSADEPITYNDEIYEPHPIGRGEFEQSSDVNRANVSLRVPRTNPVGQRNLQRGADLVTSLTIFRVDDVVSVYWKGRIAATKLSGSEIAIECESVLTSSRRMGLRARYQRNCRHALYHRGCGLDREDWAMTAFCTSADGSAITVPDAATQPTGWYLGGMAQLGDVIRFIVGHSGAELTLMRPFDDLAAAIANGGYGNNYGNHYGGVAVTIYPGCDRTKETCHTKFDNVMAHGGFSWIPIRNPFDGSAIA